MSVSPGRERERTRDEGETASEGKGWAAMAFRKQNKGVLDGKSSGVPCLSGNVCEWYVRACVYVCVYF